MNKLDQQQKKKQCPHCDHKPFAGASGLWYHVTKNHSKSCE
jgi:hypothetical protein